MAKLPSIYGSNQSQGVTGIKLGSTSATTQTGVVTITPSNIGAQVAGSYASSSHNHDSSYAAKSHEHTKSDITDFPPFFGMPNYNAGTSKENVSSYTATAPGIVFFRLGKPGSAGSTTNASINGTVLFAVAYNDTNTRRYWAILDTGDVLKNESNGNLLDVTFFPFK